MPFSEKVLMLLLMILKVFQIKNSTKIFDAQHRSCDFQI